MVLRFVIVAMLLSFVGMVSVAAAAVQAPGPVIDAAQALLQARAASYPGEATITVDPPRLVSQPPCDDLQASLSGTGQLRSRTPVTIRCQSPHPWTIYLQASVRIVGSYFVANRAIARGERLSLDDLDTRQGDLLRHRRAISDPSHIIDWIATRRIAAGSPIESNALRDPQAVQRGQQVRTLVRGPGFVITSAGQALQSGSPGTRIQVRTANGEIISGTVIDAQTVQVTM